MRGANFRWPLVLTQRGAKQCFPIFSYGGNFCLQKEAWPNGPPKYANETETETEAEITTGTYTESE